MLGVSWLMLNESASVGHLLLAVLLALAIPLVHGAATAWTRRGCAMGRCCCALGRVLVDIVLSNFDVARRVLGPETPHLQFALRVGAADVRDPHAIVRWPAS
jgi:multicomponent K+:H+ antiporter subunit E